MRWLLPQLTLLLSAWQSGSMFTMPHVRTAALLMGLMLAFAPLTPAFAQAPPVLDFLQRTNRAVPPPEAPAIEAAFAALWDRVKTREPGSCRPVVTLNGAPQPATADRMIFNAATTGEARNGWTVQATLSGCRSGTQRFVLAMLKDGSLMAIPANEGESLTTSSQFRDTVPAVLAATLTIPLLREGACVGSRTERIVTDVTERGADLGADVYGGRYAGSWRETWTVHQCGHRVAVPVVFTADGDGGVQTRVASDQVRLVE